MRGGLIDRTLLGDKGPICCWLRFVVVVDGCVGMDGKKCQQIWRRSTFSFGAWRIEKWIWSEISKGNGIRLDRLCTSRVREGGMMGWKRWSGKIGHDDYYNGWLMRSDDIEN